MKTKEMINIFFIIILLTSNMISCSSKMRKSNAQSKIENSQVTVSPSTNSQSSQTTQTTNSSVSSKNSENELSDQLKALETPSSTKVDTSLKCSAKFEKIISNLPDSLKNVVINEFKTNLNQTTCCKHESMIKSLSKALKEHQNKFTKLMSDQSSMGKKGLSCVRAPDVVLSKMKQKPDSNGTSQQKTIIDQLLKNTNQLNSDLTKCLVQINKIMIKNLGLMCGDDTFTNIFFNVDSNGKVISPKKSQENEINLYNSCSDYIKNYSNYASSILSSYTDSLNFLLGNENCNYFSNNFKFDLNADKEDPLFPSNVKNAPTNSVENLLGTWYEGIKKIDGVKEALVNQLKIDFAIAQQRQPSGLSTYIGRYDINYEIIKKTFYLSKYPAFHVQCRNSQCTAYCPQCSGLSWDSTKVISNSNTNLDVACVNNICLVLVSIIDNISGRQTIVPGAEIFLIRGNDNLKEFDNLTMAKVRNSAKCFFPSQTSSSFIQTHQNSNSTVTSDPKFSQNSTNPSVYEESKIPFSDAMLKTNLENIIKDPSQFQQDFNLATALKLKVTINGTVKRLEEHIFNTLYKTNYSFYLSCEKSVCAVQCDKCDKSLLKLSENSDADLESTSEVSKISMRTTGGSSKSSSGSKSSSSSGSKSSSSSSSTSKSSTSSGTKSSSTSSSTGASSSNSSSGSGSSTSNSKGGSNLTSNTSQKPSTGGSALTSGTSNSSPASTSNSNNISTSNTKGGSNLTGNTSQQSKGGSALTAGTSYSSPATTSTSSYVSSNMNSNPGLTKSPTVNTGFSSGYNSGTSSSYSYNTPNSYSQTSSKTYHYNYNMNNYQPTTKVKVKIYDFTPSYGASYSYYPYSYYGGTYYYPRYSYYRSYGVYGYDPYYYRPYNPYSSNTNTNNRIYLSNEFNPSDWSPSLGTVVTKSDYMKIINNQLQNVKLFVECCKLFCLTYLDSIQDNLPNKENKKRVYLDITLRGFAFINSSTLTLPQGKCLIKNTLAAYSTYNSSTGTTQGLYSKCGLPEPFDIMPIKKNCAYNMISHCAKNNFGQLMNRIASTVTSSDEKGSACSAPLSCINLPDNPSDDQKKSCGDALFGLFLDSGSKINYSALVIPCYKSTTSPSSFIQKEMIRQNLLNSSAYVNLSGLSASQKQIYESIGSQVSSNTESSISIDNSSPGVVYNSSTESQSINSSVDDIVKVSVKNSVKWLKTSISLILIVVLLLI